MAETELTRTPCPIAAGPEDEPPESVGEVLLTLLHECCDAAGDFGLSDLEGELLRVMDRYWWLDRVWVEDGRMTVRRRAG